MLRTVFSAIAGIVAWAVLVSAADFALRHAWPAYAAAVPSMAFDLPMLIARLSESTLALIIAAAIAARLAPGSRYAPLAMGIVLLAVFIPIHVGIWSKFPAWYHMTFLTSLVVVSAFAGGLARGRTAQAGTPA